MAFFSVLLVLLLWVNPTIGGGGGSSIFDDVIASSGLSSSLIVEQLNLRQKGAGMPSSAASGSSFFTNQDKVTNIDVISSLNHDVLDDNSIMIKQGPNNNSLRMLQEEGSPLSNKYSFPECIEQNLSPDECVTLIKQTIDDAGGHEVGDTVKVKIHEPRTPEEFAETYWLVEVPTDIYGQVACNRNNGKTHYPFEWKEQDDASSGTAVQDVDCLGLSAGECCLKVRDYGSTLTASKTDVNGQCLSCFVHQEQLVPFFSTADEETYYLDCTYNSVDDTCNQVDLTGNDVDELDSQAYQRIVIASQALTDFMTDDGINKSCEDFRNLLQTLYDAAVIIHPLSRKLGHLACMIGCYSDDDNDDIQEDLADPHIDELLVDVSNTLQKHLDSPISKSKEHCITIYTNDNGEIMKVPELGGGVSGRDSGGKTFDGSGNPPPPAPTPIVLDTIQQTLMDDISVELVAQTSDDGLTIEIVCQECDNMKGIFSETGVEIQIQSSYHIDENSPPLSDDEAPGEQMSFTVPYANDIVPTVENSFALLTFILLQMQEAVAASTAFAAHNSEDARRHSRSLVHTYVPSTTTCTNFEIPCYHKCCATHTRCYDENSCNSLSWVRNVCRNASESPSSGTLEEFLLGFRFGTLGYVLCGATVVFFDGTCDQCNSVSLSCMGRGCSAITDLSEVCYDNQCDEFFECPSECPSWRDYNPVIHADLCCGCRTIGVDCNAPIDTCGNGICDFGESTANCFVDCAYNRCADVGDGSFFYCGDGNCVDPKTDKNNCGACGNVCPLDSPCIAGKCSTPLSIEWTLDDTNVTDSTGGWMVTENGLNLRFVVEDSQNCGGSNFLIQSGTATAQITVTEPYNFIPTITGDGELQDSGFERMQVTLNDEVIATGESRDLDLECEMGPVQLFQLVPVPILLETGVHTFTVDFTTNDALYHLDAFYEFNLAFAPAFINN